MSISHRDTPTYQAHSCLWQLVSHACLVFLLLLPLVFSGACRNQIAEDCLSNKALQTNLLLNGPVEKGLRGGEIQCFKVSLVHEQFAHLIITQLGIDVVIDIYNPELKRVAHIDRPNSARGREGLSILADKDGEYVLRLHSLEPSVNQGRYMIRVDEIRTKRSDDDKRVFAEKLVSDAEELRAKGGVSDLQHAVYQFGKAVDLWRELRDSYEECVALYGLGLAQRSSNDNQQAIATFQAGKSIANELADRYMEGLHSAGAGWAFLHVGDTGQALNSFAAAKELAEPIDDRRGQGIALYGIGWVYALEGNDEQALNVFHQSLAIRRSLNDRRGQALALTGIGKVLNRIGRNDEALTTLSTAQELLKGSSGEAQADAFSALGWIYNSLSRSEDARSCFEKALPIWTRIGNRTGEATSLYGLARAESELGLLAGAEDHMHRALEIIETMRAKGSNQRLRTSYFGLVQDYFEFEIELLVRLHRLEPARGYAAAAFEVSERSRNRMLLDSINEANGDIREGVDPSLLEQENSLSRQLDAAAEVQQKVLAKPHTAQDAATAAKTVDDLAAQLEAVEARIRQVSPQYALITQAHPIRAVDVQKNLLDDNTLLLEYAFGKDRSYLWGISRAEIGIYELPRRADIEEIAKKLYSLLQARDKDVEGETLDDKRQRVKAADAEYPDVAMKLSKILLGPLASKLGSKRLVVVTHSIVAMIPFAALPIPEAGSEPRPLLLRHEIVNAPSASALAVFRQRIAQHSRAPLTIAVVADPVFGPDDERFHVASDPGDSERGKDESPQPSASQVQPNVTEEPVKSFPRLFGTRWEARNIASLVPSSERALALGFDADEGFVTNPALARYRIVHFATHTVIDDERPELSGIVLSGFTPDGTRRDGFLRAHEIYRLRLPVDLVVLSSCRSAAGKEVKGEGLIGFAYAFMSSGVPRLLATVWNVSDSPTAEFMVRFYRKLLARRYMTPAAALRATQLEFLRDKRWQSPYFWGAFTLHGEWRPW